VIHITLTQFLLLLANFWLKFLYSYKGIVTLASDFPSNQLHAGDLGIQNTLNIPQPTYLHQFSPASLPALLCHYARSSQWPLLQVPQTRTAYSSHAFSMAVPNIWNKLPVLAANSLPVFSQETEDTSFHCRFQTQVISVT